MATTAVPASRLHCPCCGRRMSAIRVTVATPPFAVELVGCEHCGITTNELNADAAAAAPLERDAGSR